MSLTVHKAEVVDPFHYNGDPFWDGDQTLYELDVSDGAERDVFRAVCARGRAFITTDQITHRLEGLPMTVGDLRVAARSPAPGRAPELTLLIEPGEADPFPVLLPA